MGLSGCLHSTQPRANEAESVPGNLSASSPTKTPSVGGYVGSKSHRFTPIPADSALAQKEGLTL